MDAETAHDLVLSQAAAAAKGGLRLALARALFGVEADPILQTELAGLTLPHPVGLAAGLDKNGVAIDFWAAAGFGFVEVGTVTPGQGQPGNDRPRMFRFVKDRALLNRMGFNNLGSEALGRRLAARTTRIPVGANVGKAKVTPLERAAEDYVSTIRDVWEGADYLAVNVSSPNTPGLRDLQAVDSLRPLLEAAVQENRRCAAAAGTSPRPLFLKLAPDLADEDLDAVAQLALDCEVNALIATNTTLSTAGLSVAAPFSGGISGAPLCTRALACTSRLYRAVEGRIPIVGVGGISSADDAYARIRAGASAVQIYTALVYEGPGLVGAICRGVARRLRADGFGSLAEAVGADVS